MYIPYEIFVILTIATATAATVHLQKKMYFCASQLSMFVYDYDVSVVYFLAINSNTASLQGDFSTT